MMHIVACFGHFGRVEAIMAGATAYLQRISV